MRTRAYRLKQARAERRKTLMYVLFEAALGHERCRRCGRPLTSPESRARGIGLACLAAEYDDRLERRKVH